MTFNYTKPFAGLDYTQKDFYDETESRIRTRSLFIETIDEHSIYMPLYTLTKQEKEGLPSLYKMYLQRESDFDFALDSFGNYSVLKELMKTVWFLNGERGISRIDFKGFTEWQNDNYAYLKGLAMKGIRQSVSEGNMTAIKYALSPDVAKFFEHDKDIPRPKDKKRKPTADIKDFRSRMEVVK